MVGYGMRRDARGLDGWDDDPGRIMRRIRNQGGSKRGDENRHQARWSESPHKSVYVMTHCTHQREYQ